MRGSGEGQTVALGAPVKLCRAALKPVPILPGAKPRFQICLTVNDSAVPVPVPVPPAELGGPRSVRRDGMPGWPLGRTFFSERVSSRGAKECRGASCSCTEPALAVVPAVPVTVVAPAAAGKIGTGF